MTDLIDDEHPDGRREKPSGGRGDKPYEIGRGRPPSHTKWKEGQSGNPAGARKHKRFKKREAMTAAERRLSYANEIVLVTINKRTVRMTRREYFMLLEMNEAAKNHKVRKHLLDQWDADERQLRQFGDPFEPFDWDEEQEKAFRELEKAANAASARNKEKPDNDPASTDEDGEEGGGDDDKV